MEARTGYYFGENPPGNTPVLFGDGLISTGLYERDFTVSPDGSEIYYTIMGTNYSVIARVSLENGKWTDPEIASFSGSTEYFDAEPHISPDGSRFLFLSTRPKAGQEPKGGWAYEDIWAMDRIENGWGEPYNLGPPINTDNGEYFPSMTSEGTLYFTRSEPDGNKQAIYRAEWVDGAFLEPVKLPIEVNATGTEYNACIAPDESYLIVCSEPETGTIGNTDYSVSFYEDGIWTEMINLGDPINMPRTRAISPGISADGAYFFFSSNRQLPLGDTSRHKISIDDLQLSRTSPGNGNSDIYWVSTEIIQMLKPQ